MSGSYTLLTVFEDMGTINEPVISLPMTGRISFRQIGIVVGLSVMLPMALYSWLSSGYTLETWEAISFDTVNGTVHITLDIIISLIPVPIGLVLGIPRPRMLPMDELVLVLLKFAIQHTSIQSTKHQKRWRGVVPRRRLTHNPKDTKTAKQKKSKFAGFGDKFVLDCHLKKATRKAYIISVTKLGIPKHMTITLYDLRGSPMRNKLVRVYIDDELSSSLTTDSDGVIGMTFVPKSIGEKRLKIISVETNKPVVDAILNIIKQQH